MIPALGWAAVLILCGIAGFHVMWGFGSSWPASDEMALARRVAGFKGITRMPPRRASLAVAAGVMVIAVAVFSAALGMPLPLPKVLVHVIILGGAGAFGLRGILAYVPQWRVLTPEQPFARLDRAYYGPLCLILSALIGVIAVFS